MEDDNVIFFTRWLRIYWNTALVFGVGFDPDSLILAFYLGPIYLCLGDDEE